MSGPDVAVVGTGPNGLAAGVTLARAGLSVVLHEAADRFGGGLRTTPLFDDDVVHDICSAVHPMAAASRFFREFDLAARGVELLQPEIGYAHPLDGGRAALAHRDLDVTCDLLGPDGKRWRRLMEPLVAHSTGIVDLVLSGGRALPDDWAAPFLLAGRTLAHGTALARGRFATEEADALLAGVAAHAIGRLPSLASGAIAVLLGHLAHASGWPVPRGGSARIAEAMAADITAHGGTFHLGRTITDLRELAGARAVLLDTGVKGLLRIAGDRLPRRYARRLARFRYGPAAAKVDFLVSDAIPWSHPELGRAGTVHLGGTRAEVFRAESLTAAGVAVDDPFVLLVDPGAVDGTRVRPGRRPVYAYAHVPNGDDRDPVELVSGRIERYAPGFRDTVLAARGISGRQFEAYNPNYVGGDISSGAATLVQSILRPTAQLDPYRTPLPGVYLCSAATPPGPGVHGMSGHLAALSVLRREFGVTTPPRLGPDASNA
ncbi:MULTISPECIES: phytoene desaturase family protein [Streptomyces]|uniref:Pyridine nucleotide-disulfide oxidoreductase domain-containing protein 2 n=1 Tax=Streptomyces pyridomyceticus TaxID=68260 RepID=F6K7H4_9ACTN|nr:MULTISPECIES: NAD(P)/FAD-dependent oxidoreductase [Streptomyces]AEF33087.1 putative dehydrogenase [Streptomyces pyridomyceticus]